jgi:hypothetical protein
MKESMIKKIFHYTFIKTLSHTERLRFGLRSQAWNGLGQEDEKVRIRALFNNRSAILLFWRLFFFRLPPSSCEFALASAAPPKKRKRQPLVKSQMVLVLV